MIALATIIWRWREISRHWLRYYKVPLLDLETLCETNGLTQQEAFFRTDHHWTPRAAFEGSTKYFFQWMEQSFEIPGSGR